MDTGTLLKKIWFNPRKVMAHLLDTKDPETDSELTVMLLATLCTFANAIDKGIEKSSGDETPLLMLLMLWSIGSFIMGPIGLYINAWVYGWIGKKISGCKKDTFFVRKALAFGYVPRIATLVPLSISIAFVGQELFQSHSPTLESSDSLLALLIATAAVMAVLHVWSWVTTCHTLGETFGVSAWKGLAIQATPYLVAIGVVLIALHFSGTSPTAVIQQILSSFAP